MATKKEKKLREIFDPAGHLLADEREADPSVRAGAQVQPGRS
jgi:hypothetical protein